MKPDRVPVELAPSAARAALEVVAARLRKGPCREEDIRSLAHVELTMAVRDQIDTLVKTGAVERRGALLHATRKGAALFAGALGRGTGPRAVDGGVRAGRAALPEGQPGLQMRLWRALRMRKAAELHDLVAGATDATTQARFGKLVWRARRYIAQLERAGIVAVDRTRRRPNGAGRKDRPGRPAPEVRLLVDLGPLHPYARGGALCDPNSGLKLIRLDAKGGTR